MLISCIGLFGLASFATTQRSREIGIRKVLGASVISLWKLLLRDFLVLVTISVLVGIPVASALATHWLQQYEYRTELSYLIFVLATVLVALIVIATVTVQTLKAAMASPVNALKSD